MRRVRLDAVVRSRAHAAHPALRVALEAGGGGGVADLHAHALGAAKPRAGQADTLVLRPNDGALGPFDDFANANAAERKSGFHGNARVVVHPAHGVVRVVDEDRCERRIAAPAGDAHEIFQKIGARVGFHAGGEAGQPVFGIRDERCEIGNVIVGDAQQSAAPVGVAATHLARRFFQHEHRTRAVLHGGDTRRERRVAGTDDDDVEVAHRLISQFRITCLIQCHRQRWSVQNDEPARAKY